MSKWFTANQTELNQRRELAKENDNNDDTKKHDTLDFPSMPLLLTMRLENFCDLQWVSPLLCMAKYPLLIHWTLHRNTTKMEVTNNKTSKYNSYIRCSEFIWTEDWRLQRPISKWIWIISSLVWFYFPNFNILDSLVWCLLLEAL